MQVALDDSGPPERHVVAGSTFSVRSAAWNSTGTPTTLPALREDQTSEFGALQGVTGGRKG